MIEITLKFADVAAAAAALNQLNGKQLATATVVDTAPAKDTAAGKSKPAVPAASAEPAPSPAPAPAADVKQSAAAETPKAKAIDYPTLQAAVFKLAAAVTKKGLDKQAYVVSIANEMGAPTFKELPADQWGAALDAVNAQLAKVEAVEVEVA